VKSRRDPDRTFDRGQRSPRDIVSVENQKFRCSPAPLIGNTQTIALAFFGIGEFGRKHPFADIIFRTRTVIDAAGVDGIEDGDPARLI